MTSTNQRGSATNLKRDQSPPTKLVSGDDCKTGKCGATMNLTPSNTNLRAKEEASAAKLFSDPCKECGCSNMKVLKATIHAILPEMCYVNQKPCVANAATGSHLCEYDKISEQVERLERKMNLKDEATQTGETRIISARELESLINRAKPAAPKVIEAVAKTDSGLRNSTYKPPVQECSCRGLDKRAYRTDTSFTNIGPRAVKSHEECHCKNQEIQYNEVQYERYPQREIITERVATPTKQANVMIPTKKIDKAVGDSMSEVPSTPPSRPKSKHDLRIRYCKHCRRGPGPLGQCCPRKTDQCSQCGSTGKHRGTQSPARKNRRDTGFHIKLSRSRSRSRSTVSSISSNERGMNCCNEPVCLKDEDKERKAKYRVARQRKKSTCVIQ